MFTPRLLLVVAMSIAAIAPAAAAPEGAPAPASRSGGPRIRPYDGRSAALLLDGLRRSPTLRSLVDRIEVRDVIVYIETWHGPTSRSIAGKLTWVTATPEFRYVRVWLNPELGGSQAIAVLGHELQHVLEVAEAPSIVDTASLSAFYAKHGISVRGGRDWDSESARDVGAEVRRDLSETPSFRGGEPAKGFDRTEWQAVYRRAREAGTGTR